MWKQLRRHLKPFAVKALTLLGFINAQAADALDAEDFLARGISKVEQGKLHAAMADFDRTIEINPHDAGHFIFRGIAKMDLGQTQAAIADMRQALAIDPNHQFAKKLLIGLQNHQ